MKLTKLKEPETPAIIYDSRLDSTSSLQPAIWPVSFDQMRGQSVLLPKRFDSMRFCFLPISSLLLYLNFMEQAVTDQFQQFLSEAAFGLQRAEHIGWFAGSWSFGGGKPSSWKTDFPNVTGCHWFGQ